MVAVGSDESVCWAVMAHRFQIHQLPELMAGLPSDAMREALAKKRPEFALKVIEHYRNARPKGQEAIVDLFESGALERLHETIERVIRRNRLN